MLGSFGPFLETAVWGSENFLSESVAALEVRYRIQPLDSLTVDTATYRRYSDRRSLTVGKPQCPEQGSSP